jgi:pyruvate formate lyase activating enzyme
MKRAEYWETKDKVVKCLLCPRYCVLNPGERGNCKARKNLDGKLYSIVYAKPVASYIDPVEKKPLFHFLPGTTALSIGTAGCNLHCKFCQNWSISQANPEDIPSEGLLPEQVIQLAEKNSCSSIAYTYTEPGIFYEYVLDTAKLAKKKGIKNIMVTNAFLNPAPIKELYRYIDAANIDFKAFSKDFYQKICDGMLEPVLDAMKLIKKSGAWIEITNLLIPTLNDKQEIITDMCKWIVNYLGKDTPLHFSRFFPDYMLRDLPATQPSALYKAHDTAKKVGLNYAYIGNMVTDKESTFCPRCGALVIQRFGFQILQNNMKNGKCPCGEKIAGVWK